MRPCSIIYLPPRGPRWNTDVLIQNLRDCPTHYPLVVFSDTPYDWPGLIKIGSIDAFDIGDAPKFARNNYVFFTAVRIAMKLGYTHCLYAEEDCRFGQAGWDKVVLDEFFSATTAPMLAGSVMIQNPCNGGPEAYQRFMDFLTRKGWRKEPFVGVFGHKSAADGSGATVFCNGALSVIPISTIKVLFTEDELNDTKTLSRTCTAFDLEIGRRMWKEFGPDVYRLTHHLTCCYSGFGDVLTTLSQRIAALEAGLWVAMHQCKTDYLPTKK